MSISKNAHLRISAESEALAQSLAEVRQEKPSQVKKQALELGLRVLAAAHPSVADPARLAELLRPHALVLSDLLAGQGRPLASVGAGGFPVDSTVYSLGSGERMPFEAGRRIPVTPAYDEALNGRPDLF